MMKRKSSNVHGVLSIVIMLAMLTSLLCGLTIDASANKTSPAVGIETNFAHNNYDTSNSEGTPWPFAFGNGYSLVTDISSLTNSGGRNYAAKYTVTAGADGSNPMFWGPFYNGGSSTDEHKGIAKYPKYSYSFDVMIDSYGYDYAIELWDRAGVAANASNSIISTLKFSNDGKIGISKNGDWPSAGVSSYVVWDKTYSLNTWYRVSLVFDTTARTISLCVDDEYAGSVTYKDKETFTASGLLEKGRMVSKKDWNSAETGSGNIYFDDLSADYVLDGGFYGEGVLDNDNIVVTLSEAPVSELSANDISVKKSDGTTVAIGNITISGNTITIPLTKREAAVEYVVCLPEGVTCSNGAELYNNCIYVESPLKKEDKVYVLNYDFNGDYNYEANGTTAAGNLPEFFNTSSKAKICTAYTGGDNIFSDTAIEGYEKVLKVQRANYAAGGFYINLPTTVTDDFTVEFDIAAKVHENNYASDSKGWAMRLNSGTVTSPNSNGSDANENGAAVSSASVLAFGAVEGGMLGAPNLKTAGDGLAEGQYWSSTLAKITDTATGANNTHIQVKPDDYNFNWYSVKLDYDQNGPVNTCTTTIVDKSTGTQLASGSYIMPYGISNMNNLGAQVKALSLYYSWDAGFYKDDTGKEVQADFYTYIDNLKLYTYNMTDTRVKTVTFVDTLGEEFGALDTVSDCVKSAKVYFSDNFVPYTGSFTADKFSIKDSKGEEAAFTLGEYDSENKCVELKFTKMLKVGESYTLTIDGIEQYVGTPRWNANYTNRRNIPEYTAYIEVTDEGSFRANEFKFTADGSDIENIADVNTGAEIKLVTGYNNSTAGEKDIVVISAAYDKDNKLIAADVKTIKIPANDEYSVKDNEIPTFALPEGTEKLKGFVWDACSYVPYARSTVLEAIR